MGTVPHNVSASRALYPPYVTKKLDEAVTGIVRSKLLHNRSQQYYQRSKEDKGEEYLELAFGEEDKVMKVMPGLLQELIDYTRIDAWE
jgi:hypothetical protein